MTSSNVATTCSRM